MRLDSRIKTLLGGASAIGLLVALTASGSAAAATKSAVTPNCTPATNIEGIIDDSGSMALNDSQRNRAGLIQSIAFFNPDKTMGAVEFGSTADNVFGPFLVGPSNGPNMAMITNNLNIIQADNGGTDYDVAFDLANHVNMQANARIFLSDGEPNFTPNASLWQNPKIPAYVVGFGSADFTVLNQIASETGGPVPAFAITSQNDILNKAMIINARLNCLPDPGILAKSFARPGQTKGVGLTPDGNSAEILISSAGEGDVFKASGFTQGGGGLKKGSADIAKKRSHVRVSSIRGSNYLALNLSGLRSGKPLHFQLKAKRISGPESVSIAIIQ
jgi:von Willebrand factor type A domain